MKNFFKDLIDVQKYKMKYNTAQNKLDELEKKYIDLLEKKADQIDFVDNAIRRVLIAFKDLKIRVSNLETKKKR